MAIFHELLEQSSDMCGKWRTSADGQEKEVL